MKLETQNFRTTNTVIALWDYFPWNKINSPPHIMPLSHHITTCTLTTSYAHLTSSLPTAVTYEPSPILAADIPLTKHSHLLPFLRSYWRISLLGAIANVSWNGNYLRWRVVTTAPQPKLEDHVFSVVCYCLFNTSTAAFHIGVCSAIHNLRTPHAMVIGTQLSWKIHTKINIYRITALIKKHFNAWYIYI
jgi:hypothetical protein